MTGSLQEKCGMYYAVVNFKDENGQRKQKWVNTEIETSGNNKRFAEQELRNILKIFEDEDVCYSKNINFGVYMGEWLDTMRTQVEQSTWQGYEQVINNHIKPYFQKKNISLQELQAMHIQKYYAEKLKGGLSANTIVHHHANIRNALQDALFLNMIPYNPADRVKKPKVNPKHPAFYSKAQVQELLEKVKGTTAYTAILLASVYGLRRSEVLGLKWEHIDFVNNTWIICNTITEMKDIIEKGRTKNKSSYATMPLVPEVKTHLEELKDQQAQNRLLFGDCYTENDYVCKWEDGKPFRPDYVSHALQAVIAKNHLKPLPFHGLRHSCASVLIAEGFDIKLVQEWLRHSSIATTGNIYGHLLFEQKVGIGNHMGTAILSGLC